MANGHLDAMHGGRTRVVSHGGLESGGSGYAMRMGSMRDLECMLGDDRDAGLHNKVIVPTEMLSWLRPFGVSAPMLLSHTHMLYDICGSGLPQASPALSVGHGHDGNSAGERATRRGMSR